MRATGLWKRPQWFLRPFSFPDEQGIVVAAVYTEQLYSASSSGVVSYNATANAWSVKQADTYTGELYGLAGVRPYGRQGHTAVVLEDNGEHVIVVFGGINTFSFVFFNDIWSLHHDGALWMPTPLSSSPPPTSAMASVGVRWLNGLPGHFASKSVSASSPVTPSSSSQILLGDSFYMVGGWTMSYRTYADLWTFDLPSMTWTLAPYNSDAPPPPARAHAFLGFDGIQSLILFGGAYNTPAGNWVYFGDTWAYDLTTGVWSNISDSVQSAPQPRAGGVAAYHELAGFFICGGKNADEVFMDVWRLFNDSVRRVDVGQR